MKRKFVTGLFILLFCLLFGAYQQTPNAQAQVLEEDGVYLRLKYATFDAAISQPDIPAALQVNATQRMMPGTYIIQFNQPVTEMMKASLEAQGVVLGGYLPDYAFLAYFDPTMRASIDALPNIHWVGEYQPAYKLSPGADYSGEKSYIIELAPWHERLDTENSLLAISASVEKSGDGILLALLNPDQVMAAIHLPGVLWVQPVTMKTKHNDIGGGTIMNASAAWAGNYTGAGIHVAAADTGIDTGLAATIHQDFSGRINTIASWPVQNISWGCGVPVNVGADDGAMDYDSHGTHVIGSVAGSGARSSGVFKGLAYQSTISFQALEQFVDWPSACGSALPDGYYLMGIPADVRTLLNQANGWGVKVQNWSWGAAVAGEYDIDAVNVDDFLFNNKSFTLLISAGNEGTDANSDGYVDLDSLGSPATAKNAITVGASESVRATGGYSGYTWGLAWPTDYPANPTAADRISSNAAHLAAFSSRGPTDDGRIKPDLVAPGTDIISVRSSVASGTGWGVYNAYYLYMGGTSMSAPLTTGAAALVRDYYIDSEGVSNPSSALIKATLINTAVDVSGYGNASYEAGQPIPNMHEGWGRVDVGAATNGSSRWFEENTAGLSTGGTKTYTFTLSNPTPFKVSLAWTDVKGSAAANPALVNNLNLTVTSPGGSVFRGNVFAGGWSNTGGSADTKNNVENVYIFNPQPGTWTVVVSGGNVPQGPQPYAIVINGVNRFGYQNFIPAVLSGSSTPPAADPILNGDFELGNNGNWLEYSKNGYALIGNAAYLGFTLTPHSGSNLAWLGGDDDEINSVTQTITIPASRPFLHYWYWLASDDLCGYDYARVYVGATVVQTHDLCSSNDTGGWVMGNINLSAYAGSSVALKFEVTTDSSINSNFFLDDVSFEVSRASTQHEMMLPADITDVAKPKTKP